MADWNKPTETSNYEDFPDEVRDVAQSAATMDYSSDSNIPENVMRYNRVDKKWQQRESGVWVDKELTNLAANSVGTTQIQDNAVTTAKINAGGVTTAKIADSNVTTSKIADSNVTASKIADSNVTTSKIADSNVTTAKIADANVTSSKLSSDAASRTTLLALFSKVYTSASGTQAMVAVPNSREHIIFPKTCVVTHMTLISNIIITGSMTASLVKNATATGRSLTLNSTGSDAWAAISALSFDAGDDLEVDISGTFSASPSTVEVSIWGYFPA